MEGPAIANMIEFVFRGLKQLVIFAFPKFKPSKKLTLNKRLPLRPETFSVMKPTQREQLG